MTDALKRLEEKVTKTFEALEKAKEELKVLERAKAELETRLSEKEREISALKSSARRMDDERAHVVKVAKDKSDKFKNRLEGILTKLSRLETELNA
ncbi:MAG: hypothetical protein L0Z48_01220 [candidate division Zixibacteria bacterium]|nr:hypothetical protein [candidate division Zixibacteria bacterium]MCI0595143.1 hypothetical protein [candidate division Zixibacteria bacterium]